MTQRTSDDMLRYNALDSAITWQCANGFFSEIDNGYRETYDHTIDLFQPLMYMMIRGIKVDHTELEIVKQRIDKELADLQIQINRKCGRPLNPLSSKDCQFYFYIEKGIQPYTKYNKKKQSSSITMDDKSLQRIARGTATRKGLYEAKLIQEYRGRKKLKGTYLDIIFDSDSRLRCDYKPRGTKFGRLSSAKTVFETGMNLQNLPEAFLGFLVADEGKIFIELDKRQAEWVVVAYDSGDANMIEAIESGVDVHAYTASQMFKVPVDIIKLEDKIIGHDNDPEVIYKKRRQMEFMKPYLDNWLPRTMSMRQCGKKSNHGLNYDETYKMFALINEITEKEAKVVTEFYHSTYPGIEQWYRRIQSKLGTNNRVLVNCFGRRCRFLDKWGDELFKAAYSYNPQSTVGENINRGMVSIYNSSVPELSGWEILRQVHDSIDFQTDYRDTTAIARGILSARSYLDIKLTANGREFTIATDCKIGFKRDSMVEIPITDEVSLAATLERTINELKAAK